MRRFLLGAVLALILIPACDEGSSGSLTSAALQGVVYEVDGQTVDRSGVRVTMLETGESAWTNANGDFEFAQLRPGTYTLDFATPLAARQLAAVEGEGDLHEHEEKEDGEGRPVIEVDEGCDKVVIRVALENGEVKEFTLDEHAGRHAKAYLEPTEGSEFRLEGDIKIASTEERELFKIQVAPLDPGAVIEIYLVEREGDTPDFIGTAVADADGLATFSRDTGEEEMLPYGVDFVGELSGLGILVRMAESDAAVLAGEVPSLPEVEEHDCEEPKEEPKEETDAEASKRGKDLLEPYIDFIEGHIEIKSWPREEYERFRMDICGLEPGDKVRFEIEDQETDGWKLLGVRTANGDGCAKVDTDNDLDMPFGVASVSELVGLKVRIRRSEEGNDDLLMDGVVPELVRDY
ncbi:MAG: MSCRAMM family protein [Planctomycetota bacterium]|jgi:hypothetical protein